MKSEDRLFTLFCLTSMMCAIIVVVSIIIFETFLFVALTIASLVRHLVLPCYEPSLLWHRLTRNIPYFRRLDSDNVKNEA